jgi:outer membrane receptor protein involved in Fe transport
VIAGSSPRQTFAQHLLHVAHLSSQDDQLSGLGPWISVDLTLGKDFGERISASLSAVNVANRRVELDNSVTFGGFHWNNPREIFVELRYRFHY